jgi:hypothetical protein
LTIHLQDTTSLIVPPILQQATLIAIARGLANDAKHLAAKNTHQTSADPNLPRNRLEAQVRYQLKLSFLISQNRNQ